MASPAADGLPALPPIKTARVPSSPPMEVVISPSRPATVKEEEEEEAKAAVEVEEEEEKEEPSTPTSEESRLRVRTVCPPAPRKPPPAGKRKSLSSVVFVDVPRDLSAVFRSLPPKKRIRAW